MIKVLPILITLLAIMIIVELIIERDAVEERFSFREKQLLSRVEVARRIGPAPYFIKNHTGAKTKAEKDSLFVYLSRFTIDELEEVRSEVIENKRMHVLINSVIEYKYKHQLN